MSARTAISEVAPLSTPRRTFEICTSARPRTGMISSWGSVAGSKTVKAASTRAAAPGGAPATSCACSWSAGFAAPAACTSSTQSAKPDRSWLGGGGSPRRRLTLWSSLSVVSLAAPFWCSVASSALSGRTLICTTASKSPVRGLAMSACVDALDEGDAAHGRVARLPVGDGRLLHAGRGGEGGRFAEAHAREQGQLALRARVEGHEQGPRLVQHEVDHGQLEQALGRIRRDEERRAHVHDHRRRP